MPFWLRSFERSYLQSWCWWAGTETQCQQGTQQVGLKRSEGSIWSPTFQWMAAGTWNSARWYRTIVSMRCLASQHKNFMGVNLITDFWTHGPQKFKVVGLTLDHSFNKVHRGLAKIYQGLIKTPIFKRMVAKRQNLADWHGWTTCGIHAFLRWVSGHGHHVFSLYHGNDFLVLLVHGKYWGLV